MLDLKRGCVGERKRLWIPWRGWPVGAWRRRRGYFCIIDLFCLVSRALRQLVVPDLCKEYRSVFLTTTYCLRQYLEFDPQQTIGAREPLVSALSTCRLVSNPTAPREVRLLCLEYSRVIKLGGRGFNTT